MGPHEYMISLARPEQLPLSFTIRPRDLETSAHSYTLGIPSRGVFVCLCLFAERWPPNVQVHHHRALSGPITMATSLPSEKRDVDPEQVERVESRVLDDDLKHRSEDVDQFGAHKRKDAAEIALVRKMDIYIIVSSLSPSRSLRDLFSFTNAEASPASPYSGSCTFSTSSIETR